MPMILNNTSLPIVLCALSLSLAAACSSPKETAREERKSDEVLVTTPIPDAPAGGDLAAHYPIPPTRDGAVGSAEFLDRRIESIAIIDNTITADDLAHNIVGTNEIIEDSRAGASLPRVTEAMVVDKRTTNVGAFSSIGSAEVVDATIPGLDIPDNSISSADITDNSVTSADVQDNTLVLGNMMEQRIKTVRIIDNTILGGDIDNNSITVTHIIDPETESGADNMKLTATPIHENSFLSPVASPLSTFSIDVDAASYTTTRRSLVEGELPPVDGVRIEEMVNYFTYDYPEPTGDDPFSVVTETAICPWNTNHRLAHIGIQGKRVAMKEIPAGNLVFLIDVSGSMAGEDRLELLKKAFGMLVDQLREQDRVAIVTYAGAAGLALPSTSGSRKATIRKALDNLQSGGSTAGGKGIELAYKIARENFRKNGNNRVILATDGDFNVGVSSDKELVKLIERKREEGIFLSVLGVGIGNYMDSKMEALADNGNGNYAYLDNVKEAERVLVNELGATIFTIAKDVKIQIDFNPKAVAAYRLIGYENRVLAARDFDDDRKDAGELGAGHSVTALYEIVPVGAEADVAVEAPQDSMKHRLAFMPPPAYADNDLMEVRLRYKHPADTVSNLLGRIVVDSTQSVESASENFRFASAVAQFGLLLRNSRYRANASYDDVIALALGAQGSDRGGYRAEFVTLVEAAKRLAGAGGTRLGSVVR